MRSSLPFSLPKPAQHSSDTTGKLSPPCRVSLASPRHGLGQLPEHRLAHASVAEPSVAIASRQFEHHEHGRTAELQKVGRGEMAAETGRAFDMSSSLTLDFASSATDNELPEHARYVSGRDCRPSGSYPSISPPAHLRWICRGISATQGVVRPCLLADHRDLPNRHAMQERYGFAAPSSMDNPPPNRRIHSVARH
jgi:hypothetical protein